MRKLKLEELGRLEPEAYKQAPKTDLILVADNIRSALNIGSLFRSCDAFAIRQLLLVGVSAQPPHKEIRKTAIGAHETVDWRYFKTAEEALNYLKEQNAYRCILEQTDASVPLKSLSLEQAKDRPIALVAGNEVGGVSDTFVENCDIAVEIEQFGTKHSLNVSVATGIALWVLQKNLRT